MIKVRFSKEAKNDGFNNFQNLRLLRFFLRSSVFMQKGSNHKRKEAGFRKSDALFTVLSCDGIVLLGNKTNFIEKKRERMVG